MDVEYRVGFASLAAIEAAEKTGKFFDLCKVLDVSPEAIMRCVGHTMQEPITLRNITLDDYEKAYEFLHGPCKGPSWEFYK